MVKLQVGDSVFFCDTAEEAVRIHRLISSNGSAGYSPARSAERPVAKSSGKSSGVGALLQKLEPLGGKYLNSEELAKVIGAKSPLGVGPKMAQLRKAFAADGMSVDEFIEKKQPGTHNDAVAWLISEQKAA